MALHCDLTRLYPFVDEGKTPLPRSWNPKDKFNFLSLTENNLRIHYKGAGKNHKDAAAVRATHPVPAACGIYYFEVKIISKGRDGYMGIGFSQRDVNLNRLPGWDKNSFGYHGDDGCSFCSTGQGRAYGPTFSTDDVIGCGLNLVENTCFYTKNGQNLGVAFTDLPMDLYPTVGLQTPLECVEANFGQTPFVYDIEQDIKEAQMKVKVSVENFPVTDATQKCFPKLISDYLVHHGYHEAAVAFGNASNQKPAEDTGSIKDRQRIQKLIMDGCVSIAMEAIESSYPQLLQQNPDLLFMLKCRQFIEMLAGSDSEAHKMSSHSSSPYQLPPHRAHSRPWRPSPMQSPKNLSPRNSPRRIKSPKSSPVPPFMESENIVGYSNNNNNRGISSRSNSSSSISSSILNGIEAQYDNERHMEEEENIDGVRSDSQEPCQMPLSSHNGCSVDGVNGKSSKRANDSDDCSMEEDGVGEEAPVPNRLCGGNPAAIEKLLQFGRELQQMSSQLKHQHGSNIKHKKMLRDAFSLLAYCDPYNSPVSYQLEPEQRELTAAAVNSAILALYGQPPKPSLEVLYCQAKRLRQELANAGLGSSAFLDTLAFMRKPN